MKEEEALRTKKAKELKLGEDGALDLLHNHVITWLEPVERIATHESIELRMKIIAIV